MRLISFVSILLVIIILAWQPEMVMSYTQLAAMGVSGQGTKPIVVGQLLDDFTLASNVNLWNDLTSAWNGNGGVCTASYTTSGAYGGTGKSLVLTYNVGATDSYSGYSSKLGGANLTGYRAVKFWVKGAVGGEFFKMELATNNADTTRQKHAIYITDILDGGVTTSWKQVVVAFNNFPNMRGVTSMKELSFVFEKSQSTANGSPTSGTIYLDNIEFMNSGTYPSSRVDHFGDALGTCTFGGNIASGGGGGGTASYLLNQTTFANYTRSLQYVFNVSTPNSYAYVTLIFGGGSDGWTAKPCYLSPYNNMTIWMKAKDWNNNPRGFKIQINDLDTNGNGQPFVKIGWNATAVNFSYLTDTWKQYRFSLSNFKDYGNNFLDKQNATEMAIVIEDTNAYNKTGTIFVDGITFEL